MNSPDRQEPCETKLASQDGDRLEPDELGCSGCLAMGQLAPLLSQQTELLQRIVWALEGGGDSEAATRTAFQGDEGEPPQELPADCVPSSPPERPTSGGFAVGLVPLLEEVRDLLRPLLSSDTSKGLAALRGRKTFLRLLLGVLPAHDTAELLPGTGTHNKRTLGRLGLLSEVLGNRGGVVVVDKLRRLLAGDQPNRSNSGPPRRSSTPDGLKRSKLFD